MAKKTHDHRADPKQEQTRPFSGPVSARPNPGAHGNVCYVDRCRCGAERRSNVNRLSVELGAWSVGGED